MKRICYIIAFTLLFGMVLPPAAHAKKKKVDIYELSLDDNLEEPEITNDKQADRVQEYQYKVALELKREGYEVELMRDDEVIIVTILASRLFAANDTVITDVGAKLLSPLTRYLKNPGFYKMLLVMHSDNTGSPAYTLNLTRQRVNAVFDWFDAKSSVDFVVPYALGETEPITDNNSMESRKKNRRLEVYLVPDEVMLQQAKKGNININYIAK